MFNFIKKLFGVKEVDEAVQAIQPEPVVKTDNAILDEPASKPKKISKAELNKMTKNDLEAFAKDRFGVDIDKRKKKASLVDQVHKLQ